MWYDSRCGKYRLLKSDQIYGQPLDVTWLALYLGPTKRVLSRHRTRLAAERAVEKHAKSLS